MRDELYIDGKKADVDDNTSISLNYKSNFLTDISKIVSNNSYTIKLPKTANNLRIIEMVHIPSAVCNFPYIVHAGTLVRDGIEIIRDANVVLLSVSEQIEIALSWGNVSNFDSIADGDASLRDLSYNMSVNTDYVDWQKLDNNTAQFPNIGYGFKNDEEEVWYHPVVTVEWVMNKIASSYGITFDFPDDVKTKMESMIIPLLSRNDAQNQIDSNSSISQYLGYEELSRSEGFVMYRRRFFFNFPQLYNYYVDFKFGDTGIGAIGFNPKFSNVKIHIQWSVKIRVTNLSVMIDVLNLDIVLMNPSNRAVYATFSPTSRTDLSNEGLTGTYELTYDIDEDVELVDDDGNAYDLSNYLEISTSEYWLMSIQSIEAGYLYFSPYSETIGLHGDNINSRFYYVPNLPDISQLDFLKSVTSMLGLFAVPTSQFSIKFVPFDVVIGNKSKAVDWSGRLINQYLDKTPQDISYTIDNFAQHNRFLYKEDEDVSGDYDGDMVVDNKTIEYERDVIELKFSASDTRNGVAYIPIYSYDSDGKLEYDDSASPRILLLTEENKGVFSGLEWETLLSDNYDSYKNIVNNPRVIVENIRLSAVELQMLDLTVPVYLSQYGSYWVVISVKTKENDICEVKLLKM